VTVLPGVLATVEGQVGGLCGLGRHAILRYVHFTTHPSGAHRRRCFPFEAVCVCACVVQVWRPALSGVCTRGLALKLSSGASESSTGGQDGRCSAGVTTQPSLCVGAGCGSQSQLRWTTLRSMAVGLGWTGFDRFEAECHREMFVDTLFAC
jgi:hypothetical protein